ncbi:MAG: hypothetical protein RXO23_04350 [Vulcanisaeta sp.]
MATVIVSASPSKAFLLPYLSPMCPKKIAPRAVLLFVFGGWVCGFWFCLLLLVLVVLVSEGLL